jgi:hypothetical protein
MSTGFDFDDLLMDPYSSGRHAQPQALPDTVPIPLPPDPPQTEPEPTPMPVKVSETCGICGSSLALEWGGRLDTLRVLRDWRATHRCHPDSTTGD